MGYLCTRARLKMADSSQVFLGLPDERIKEEDDNLCNWSTNKFGGCPVCIAFSFRYLIIYVNRIEVEIVSSKVSKVFVFFRTGCLAWLMNTLRVNCVEDNYFLFHKSTAPLVILYTTGHCISLAVLAHLVGINHTGTYTGC